LVVLSLVVLGVGGGIVLAIDNVVDANIVVVAVVEVVVVVIVVQTVVAVVAALMVGSFTKTMQDKGLL